MTPAPVTGVELRAARIEDAPAIAEVCNALTRSLYGEADVDAAAIAGWFGLPDIAMFVAEREGRVVGYVDVQHGGGGRRFPVDARVHPGLGDEEVGDALLAAAEEWARGRAVEGAEVRAFVADRDEAYRRAVVVRGYAPIRHSFQMEIELGGPIEEPVWPEGVTVRTYERERDELAVYECAQEAFADHWDFHPATLETWRGYHTADPRFDPELWWLVEDGGELAAVSLNAWYFSGDPRHGWVNTLAVRRAWRRRGLGLALLRHSFRDFAARGATRVGLGVDGENLTGAVRLYERAGMRVLRRSDTYARVL